MFRNGSHPDAMQMALPADPGMDPRVEADALAEVEAARRHAMRALKLVDGTDLARVRSDARLQILRTAACLDEARGLLGGEL